MVIMIFNHNIFYRIPKKKTQSYLWLKQNYTKYFRHKYDWDSKSE